MAAHRASVNVALRELRLSGQLLNPSPGRWLLPGSPPKVWTQGPGDPSPPVASPLAQGG